MIDIARLRKHPEAVRENITFILSVQAEHSMIGKFIDTIHKEEDLPYTDHTSYSPCFRKEKGAHGIEERGVYRIHQFEKQEMIVVCKPEDSKMWFDKLWQNTVDLFRSMDIPVRTLECCSGDLADLKVRSLDVEAWSPRQKKYFDKLLQPFRLHHQSQHEDARLLLQSTGMMMHPSVSSYLHTLI